MKSAATRGHVRDGVQSGREWDDTQAAGQLIVMGCNNRNIDTIFPDCGARGITISAPRRIG
jgi:hypothetical protein